ncbi:asparagine synthase (glutamine-hydrolyzing) [Endothiovibrio diazotrophicus]
MCGIAGYFGRLPDEDNYRRSVVNRMLELIRHRGPDDQGAWACEEAGVGMVRLSIIDRDDHEIPYFNEDRSVALVFNGEIYNHQALRAQFKHAHRFANNSDTETLVHAYEEWGMGMLDKLNGMYAIAVYDARLRKLFVARDVAGEKPLYYAERDGILYFASEVKSLLPYVPPKANDSCLAYHAFEICCDRETLFEGIHSVLPGEYLEVSAGGVKRVTYWRVEDHRVELPDDLDTLERMLTDLVVDCVEVRTQNSSYDYASLLSGGVDSSLLACIAKPEYLFTVTYDVGDEFNELRYAQEVADHIGRELHIVRPTREDFEAYREEIMWFLDYPCTWTSFNEYVLLKEVAKKTRVTITGEGVDELFGGYHRYHLLNHDQKIFELEAMENYSFLINKYYGSPAERYGRLINRAENPFDPRVQEYLRSCVEGPFATFPGVISAMGLVDYYTSMQVLLQMADRMNMAFSIENRAPFLDPRLIQFAYSLPDKYKINDGVTKWLFKKVAGKFVPDAVVKRKNKMGFLSPINVWYRMDNSGQLYDRSMYRQMVFEDWNNVFFQKRRFLVPSPDAG